MTGSGSWNQVQPRLLCAAPAATRASAHEWSEAAGRVLALKRRLGLRAPVAR